MSLNTIPLRQLLISGRSEEDIKTLLYSFECNSLSHGASDVESFLHNKAIQYEKMDMARTYLVMSDYNDLPYLGGYFSITNKPLVIPKKFFNKLSTSLKKRLMGMGHKTDQQNYQINGFLLGQLGKNYNEISKKARGVTGNDLIALSYEKVKESYELSGGRILYLECENHPKIISFYENQGFSLIEQFESVNELKIMVKKLSDL
ncbi:hypothetical protein [Listeria grayi]|uniref:Acetyltransferase, GNAT family n=1 Tax=Listeria grayi DSM 20601 TaxID=525367 RepID=D7V0Q4_LISGR|nr:hypothetical protein [Listeria grayi]EFI83136.1 hypothetical protein HMPREF0556_11821 [Listeria grayi DSM 20601]